MLFEPSQYCTTEKPFYFENIGGYSIIEAYLLGPKDFMPVFHMAEISSS